VKASERAMPDKIQAAGASTSIRRTCEDQKQHTLLGNNISCKNILYCSMYKYKRILLRGRRITITPEKYTDVTM
jgi:hypothetical protein